MRQDAGNESLVKTGVPSRTCVLHHHDTRRAQAELEPEDQAHSARQGPKRIVQVIAHRLVVNKIGKQGQGEHEAVDQEAAEQQFGEITPVCSNESQNGLTHGNLDSAFCDLCLPTVRARVEHPLPRGNDMHSEDHMRWLASNWQIEAQKPAISAQRSSEAERPRYRARRAMHWQLQR
jgi:hypothetical protein